MSEKKESIVRDIDHTVTLNAPVDKVWDMVSTGENISKWFMQTDLKPEKGNEFTIHSIYGSAPCEVLEVKNGEKLSFSWDSFGWQVTFSLKGVDGKTSFNLVHTGWGAPDSIIPGADEKSSEVRDRMEFGWANVLNKLKEELAK